MYRVELCAWTEDLEHIFVILVLIYQLDNPVLCFNLGRHFHFKNNIRGDHEAANCHFSTDRSMLPKHHKDHQNEGRKTHDSPDGMLILLYVRYNFAHFFDEVSFFVENIVFIVRLF